MLIFLILIFSFLTGIHVYWAFGGQWSADIVLPTDPTGKKMLSPSPLMTAIVSNGLFAFAVYYMLMAGWVHFMVPSWLMTLAGWGIPTIFLVRAIGDFNYVGFFRKVKDTPFGIKDQQIFTPLCLLISVLGFLVQTFM